MVVRSRPPLVPIPIRTYDMIEGLLKKERKEHTAEGRNALKRLRTFRDRALRRLGRPAKDPEDKEWEALRDRADELLSTYIRTKWTRETAPGVRVGECFTCKKLKRYEELQNGHWIRRRHFGTRWHEINNHPQCAWCNDPKRGGGMEAEHERQIAAIEGSQWPDRLRALKKLKAKKPTKFELLAIIKDLNTKIAGLKNAA